MRDKSKQIEETDLGQYIVIYYSHLLTLKEKMAYKHHLTTLKAENSSEQFGEMMLRKWGKLARTPQAK